MAKQTTKHQLLADIRTERRRLEKHLFALGVEAMARPGVTGAWSVKDLLAHLAAWQRLLLDWIAAGVQGRTPAVAPVGLSRTSIDALNEQIYEQNRRRSLEDVLAEFHAAHRQIVAVVEAIPEGDLFARGRFHWTGRLTLADYIAGNTCNHDAWARSQISRWAKRESQEGA